MVYVRLARDWTDDGGSGHIAGDLVDVDPVTLAELEADGVVASAERAEGDEDQPDAWPGPTSPDPDVEPAVEPASWPGPTEADPDAWPGPTTEPASGPARPAPPTASRKPPRSDPRLVP